MADTQLFSFLSQHWSFLVLISLWTLPWKGVALWQAAKRRQLWWFIIIFLTNTVAILEIFYLFFIVKIGQQKKSSE